jgi:putative ABC transport system permease protein
MLRATQGGPMPLFRRIANLFSRSRVDSENDTELRAHVDLRIADNIAAGMPPEEARRDAMLRFGNATAIKERVAAADAALALSSVGADVRYALRQLRKSPGFAAAVILTLALGIGPNTAVFSVMNSVLLRPLAYPRPDRIFQFEKGTPSDSTYSASVALFLEWRRENTTFEHIAAYSVLPVGFNLAVEGKPERVPGLRVSADFFRVLGVAPHFGRDFADGEDRAGSQPVAILSSSLWHRRYANDPDLVGKTINLDGRATTVVGILPQGFQFLATMPTSKAIEIWTPLELPAASRDPGGILECVGRLRDGVSEEQAATQMTALGHRAAAEVSPVFPSDGVVTLLPLQQRITGDTRPTILLFFGAVSFVLLIACANAANLMLARMSSRAKEIGVRGALGASRFRILRQILTETAVLALSGGALGVLIAWLCDRVLIAIAPLSIARAGEVHIDWRVMVFALAVSLLTGVAAGLLPAVRMAGVGASDALRDSSSRRTTSGRSHRRISAALVTAEMALSLMLLIAAGLLIESFLKLERVDPGFDYDRVGTFETTLSVARYGNTAALERFIRDVSQRIEALPGVESAAALSTLPTQPTLSFPFTAEGGPAPAPGQSTGESDYLIVSADFFRTLRIPILKGRALAESDGAQSPGVVVINQTMARKYFPNQNPIGRRIVIAKNLGPDWVDVPREIVGICGDAKNDSLEEVPPPTMFTPFAQAPQHTIAVLLDAVPLHWAVKTTAEPAALTAQLEAAVASVDAEEPIAEARDLRDLLADSLDRWRFNMILVAVFAGIALLLAAVGIYGVISYAVAQRTQEIGIRMALGAGRGSVLWMVLRQAGVLLGAGAIVGLAGLAGMGRLLKGFIYGVSFADAGVLISVTALLCFVGLIAAWRPARRAASVDPMKALRSE